MLLLLVLGLLLLLVGRDAGRDVALSTRVRWSGRINTTTTRRGTTD